MSAEEYIRKLLQAPEPDVDQNSHRCRVCRTITYDKFRADNIADEFFNKRTFIVGSFEYLRKSAFAGCHVCRLLFRSICQTPTHDRETDALYFIQKVGLRLSLDDELTIHCWTDAGPISLWNDGPDVIEIKDFNPAILDGESSPSKKSNLDRDSSLLPCIDADNSVLPDSDSRIFNPNPKSGVDDRVILPIWLETCISGHPDCLNYDEAEPPILPTRILDVGASLESSTSRVITTNGKRAPYLTLSHCWGKTSHTMTLTHDSMKSMLADIKDDEMPVTFRHAIMITRALDQRYLWIDSMCIIQPVKGDICDWEREGPRMAEYYGNSLLNIAASAALDNTEGCFHGKAGSQLDVEPFPLFESPVRRKWNEFDQIMGRNPEWLPVMQPKPASWLHHVQDSPLSSRAWVLQERCLSPRTLHCTAQGFFWECSMLRASEYEPVGCRFDYGCRDEGLSNAQKILKESYGVIIGSYWRSIVERYTQLNLSVGSDRLPALAGLAKLLQTHTKDRYTAGHWQGSLISSLLWFRLKSEGEGEEENILEESIRFDAPSWSWASLPGQVKFTSFEISDYPTRNPKEYNFPAKFVHVNVEPAGTNMFSWVATSNLKVFGRLRDHTISGGIPDIRAHSPTNSEYWHGYLPMSESIGQLRAIQMPSSIEQENQSHHFPHENLSNDGFEIPDQSPLTSSGTTEVDAISSAIATATIVADNDLLQVQIKETMENVTQSEKWKKLDEQEKAETAKQPKGMDVIFDFPLSESISKDKLALLQLLYDSREKKHEGLVLTSDDDGKRHRRIGFFTLKGESEFDGIDMVEVEIV